MKLLDLFCGAGGASWGYHLAGFDEIIGVDIEPQPRYPFEFVQADAFEYLAEHGQEFDLIHASPICKGYTRLQRIHDRKYPNQIPTIRKLLKRIGRPYVIENVPGSPLHNPIMLCGTMFGLDVIRHRIFETSPLIWFTPAMCCHYKELVKCGRQPNLAKQFHNIAGHFSGVKEAREAMGIDWMIGRELSQAIPPVYTEYIGQQILELID